MGRTAIVEGFMADISQHGSMIVITIPFGKYSTAREVVKELVSKRL